MSGQWLKIPAQELSFTIEMNYLITFFASFLIWLMFLGLFVLQIFDGKIKKELVAHAILVAFAAWGLSQMIKEFFPTIRPFQLNGLTPLTLTIPSDGAYPSGHAAAAFALSVSVWLHNKKLGIYYLAAAVLVGIGRVLSQVHFPLDIVGGAVLGSFLALLADSLHFKNTPSNRP